MDKTIFKNRLHEILENSIYDMLCNENLETVKEIYNFINFDDIGEDCYYIVEEIINSLEENK